MVYTNAILAGRSGMGEGAEPGGFGMRQLTLSKGLARMGIRNIVHRDTIPSKGFLV